MKRILLSTILLASNLMASNGSYNYSSIGAGMNLNYGIPAPIVHFGHRERWNNYALDSSVGCSTLFVATALQTSVNGLNYVNADGLYLGGGLTGQMVLSYETPDPIIECTTNFIIGKENEKNFHQVKVAGLSISNCYGVTIAPFIAYQYGFKF